MTDYRDKLTPSQLGNLHAYRRGVEQAQRNRAKGLIMEPSPPEVSQSKSSTQTREDSEKQHAEEEARRAKAIEEQRRLRAENAATSPFDSPIIRPLREPTAAEKVAYEKRLAEQDKIIGAE